jgi:hypothetical protein
MTDNLFAALPPVADAIVIAGETLDITPLRIGELPQFARAVQSIAGRLSADPDWLLLLAEDGDAALQALAIACRRPITWVSELAVDDAIRLAEAVFAANADFFLRRVVPEITRASSGLGGLIPGAIPSTACSAPATATPTS